MKKTEIVYTPHQICEIARCRTDYKYCISKYIKTIHPVKGMVPFKLFDYQEDLIDSYVTNLQTIVLSSRQMGKTATSAAFLLLEAIFKENQTILITSAQQSGAVEVLDRIRDMTDSLPSWLCPQVIMNNRTQMQFDNGSKIVARATTPKAGRGLSISILYCDELAHVPKNIGEDFWTAIYPVISAGGKVIITSTPNGDNNRFYYIWRDAYIIKNQKDGFVPILIHWSQHPDRDEEWARRTRAAMGDDSKWMQEFENSFLSNARTLVEISLLEDMKKEVKEKIQKPAKFTNDNWVFFKYPKPKHEYFIFVDVSEGVGIDYHAINVFDEHLEQVALLNDNVIDIEELSKQIYIASEYFNEAQIYLEKNGPGLAVVPYIEKIHEIGERLRREKPGGPAGLRMTRDRRSKGITNLRQNLIRHRLKLNSINTINELKVFKRPANSSKFQAEYGCHDDIVMTLVMLSSEQDHLAILNDNINNALYLETELNRNEEEINMVEPPPMIGNNNDDTNDFDWLLQD